MTLPVYLMRPQNDGRAQYPHDPTKLVLVYDTNLQPNNTVISVPTFGSSPSGTIDWGDGSSSSFLTSAFQTHTYASHGVYTVQISGRLTALNYTVSSNTQQNKPKLIKCLSYGNLGITNLENAFSNCRNVNYIPSALPTGSITDIDYAFYDTTLNDGKIVSYWQPSSMTTINGTFAYNTAFNQDITSWNTTNVTSTYETFRSATSFNQNISTWNMSSNTNMNYMFAGATSFNQNIGTWDVSNVTTLANTFDGATSFNQNLSGWDISGLTSSSSLNNFMRSVTLSSTNYDSLLNNWNTNKSSYRNDLVPNFGSSKYSPAASGARAGLISYGWVITDGGPV